jgi:protein DJ-1
MTRAIVVLAEGAEEMELTIAVDVLRRAGVEVTIAGLDSERAVTCSRGVRIVPDARLSTLDELSYDVLVLPGGAPGARRIAASAEVGAMLRSRELRDAWVAAICGAPVSFVAHRVFAGRRVTSHPSVSDEVGSHCQREDGAVVVDGKLVTSQGPGTSFEFALTLVALLCGVEMANEVRAPMRLIG